MDGMVRNYIDREDGRYFGRCIEVRLRLAYMAERKHEKKSAADGAADTQSFLPSSFHSLFIYSIDNKHRPRCSLLSQVGFLFNFLFFLAFFLFHALFLWPIRCSSLTLSEARIRTSKSLSTQCQSA